MGHIDRLDEGLLVRIRQLIDGGYFKKGTEEHSIALLVADEGEAALSPTQKAVWEDVIIPTIKTPLDDEQAFQEAQQRDREAAKKG